MRNPTSEGATRARNKIMEERKKGLEIRSMMTYHTDNAEVRNRLANEFTVLSDLIDNLAM